MEAKEIRMECPGCGHIQLPDDKKSNDTWKIYNTKCDVCGEKMNIDWSSIFPNYKKRRNKMKERIKLITDLVIAIMFVFGVYSVGKLVVYNQFEREIIELKMELEEKDITINKLHSDCTNLKSKNDRLGEGIKNVLMTHEDVNDVQLIDMNKNLYYFYY